MAKQDIPKRDLDVLKYSGLMGHEYLTCRDYPRGETRVCSEATSVASAMDARFLMPGDRIYRIVKRKPRRYELLHTVPGTAEKGSNTSART